MNNDRLSTAKALAVAVLNGDEDAALLLADVVKETMTGTTGEIIPPVRTLRVNVKKLRVVLHAPADAVFNVAETNRAVRRWVNGVDPTLCLAGIDRIELYELLDAPDADWSEPDMLLLPPGSGASWTLPPEMSWTVSAGGGGGGTTQADPTGETAGSNSGGSASPDPGPSAQPMTWPDWSPGDDYQ